MVSSLFRLVNWENSPQYAVATAQNLRYSENGPSHRRVVDGSYPDFGVQIVDGVVWFWLLEQWQDLPNELWAWKLVTVWTAGHFYHRCNIWIPSLLLFNTWEYDRSSFAPVLSSTIDRQPVPSAKAIVASWLPQILHNFGYPRLRGTCRLVCRDWVKVLPFGEPGRDYLRFQDGAVWYWIEREWRHLPHKYWAWKLRDVQEWWDGYTQYQWFPKLVQPADDSIPRGPKYLSTPSSSRLPSGASRNPGFSRAAALPQELFKYICREADSDSWSFRLVSRYWSRQCHAQIFQETFARTPERIHELWAHRMDPLMQQLELIRDVPDYDSDSEFPWLHHLTQLCDSTRSAWMGGYKGLGGIRIRGPFASKFGRIRSVHFALPRSLPRSLSRGIKSLDLRTIEFRRFEDLAHLVCELPDLEELECNCLDLDSPPIELPRRPRTNRNKLSRVRIWDACNDEPTFPQSPSILRLFLSVYAAPSFFSEGELSVSRALLQLVRLRSQDEYLITRYEDHPHDHSRRIVYFRCGRDDDDETVFSLHILQDPTRTHIILNIIVEYWSARRNLARWIRLDTEFSKIADLIHRAECVFGFMNRKVMVHFATNILVKMPSISRLATIRYSICKEASQSKWFRASLDSEELTGAGEIDLAKVYS